MLHHCFPEPAFPEKQELLDAIKDMQQATAELQELHQQVCGIHSRDGVEVLLLWPDE